MGLRMKETIKKILAKNTYVNAKVYSVLSAKSRREMEEICAEAAQDDSIADVSWLKQYRKDVKDGKRRFYTTDCNFSNSHIYGIWHSLFSDFDVDPIYTPSVEHGLIFHNQIFNDIQDTARAACVTFGEFRRNIIRQYTDMPVFCVGPYIQYAKPFYEENKIKEEKQKNGKTLLVFPMHSTDTSELSVEVDNYRKYLRKKQGEFDTILINSFWWNINDPLTEALRSDGYKIVSAGIRDDVMFMSRLKTLIQLSDLVVGDSIGTHVGYCVNCGVPFSYEPLGSVLTALPKKESSDLDFCDLHMNKIKKAFYNSESITEEQRDLCKYYWGQEYIYSKTELTNIVNATKKITKILRGQRSLYSRDRIFEEDTDLTEPERRLLDFAFK